MVSYRKLRRLADYRAGTRNEIAVDEYMRAEARLPESLQLNVPRVQRWSARALRFPRLMRAAASVAVVSWPCFIAPALFSMQLLQLMLLKARQGTSPPLRNGSVIGAGFSERAVELINTRGFPVRAEAWLTFPWVGETASAGRPQQVGCLGLIRYRDLAAAWIDAMAAVLSWRHSRQLAPWILQTYTAMRWFVAIRAIESTNAHWLCAEHYDRWAVLLDRTVRRHRGGWTLVQHGSVTGLSGQDTLELPTRLRRVSQLICFDQDSLDFFHRKVLALGACACPVTNVIHRPSIQTRRLVDREAGLRLLIVGHPFSESLQVRLHEKICSIFPSVVCFYKPHPHAAMSHDMRTVGWRLVEDPACFPEVDLLLSYPSTLVNEYASAGIEGVIHPISGNEEEAVSVWHSLEARIRDLQPSHIHLGLS